MSFVTIAGIPVRVLDGTAFEEEPELQGDAVRLDDGTLDSSERSPKRGFAFVAKFDPPADFDTLREAISVSGEPGAPILVSVESPVDGLTRGVTLQCYCRLGRGQYKSKDANTTTYLTAPVALKEA